MWVKICGNTRLEDCLRAAELGADAVGFVFAQGKRTVTADQVAAITKHLPASLETVGVFTTQDVDGIAGAVHQAALTAVQLHSEHHAPFVAELRQRFRTLDRPVRVLQVVHWNLDAPTAQEAREFAARLHVAEEHSGIDELLVDTRTAGVSGGTGVRFDWAAAGAVLQSVQKPVIVAGGLNPENVATAIATLRPTGVDVSSGVERAPGVKDAEAMRTFIKQARAALS